MLYYLFEYLQQIDFPGSRLMTYITFRSGVAFVLALLLAVFAGKWIIGRLQLMQVGEIVRDLDLEGQTKKTGTPTMGGVIIILSILLPCLLVGDLGNPYMLLMLVSTLWLGSLGFLDDYKKIQKHNKDGIKGKYKIVGQLGIAIILAGTMYLNPDMVTVQSRQVVDESTGLIEQVVTEQSVTKSPETTLPFVKDNNFDYSWLTSWMGGDVAETGGWIVFVLIVMFLVTATSNGANLNDGLDGMTSGLSAIAGVALAIMAYLGGNVVYSTYLDIMYIPHSEELVVYMAAFIGALIGFLWYNAYPAQVFMGDTGSLTLGGIIAVYAILIHKELLLPILCALFYLEDLSVMAQVLYFKKTGGKRIFKMAPLHHHFQKPAGTVDALIQYPRQAVPEAKIVTRFWIIGIILAVVTFVTLKIR